MSFLTLPVGAQSALLDCIGPSSFPVQGKIASFDRAVQEVFQRVANRGFLRISSDLHSESARFVIQAANVHMLQWRLEEPDRGFPSWSWERKILSLLCTLPSLSQEALTRSADLYVFSAIRGQFDAVEVLAKSRLTEPNEIFMFAELVNKVENGFSSRDLFLFFLSSLNAKDTPFFRTILDDIRRDGRPVAGQLRWAIYSLILARNVRDLQYFLRHFCRRRTIVYHAWFLRRAHFYERELLEILPPLGVDKEGERWMWRGMVMLLAHWDRAGELCMAVELEECVQKAVHWVLERAPGRFCQSHVLSKLLSGELCSQAVLQERREDIHNLFRQSIKVRYFPALFCFLTHPQFSRSFQMNREVRKELQGMHWQAVTAAARQWMRQAIA